MLKSPKLAGPAKASLDFIAKEQYVVVTAYLAHYWPVFILWPDKVLTLYRRTNKSNYSVPSPLLLLNNTLKDPGAGNITRGIFEAEGAVIAMPIRQTNYARVLVSEARHTPITEAPGESRATMVSTG